MVSPPLSFGIVQQLYGWQIPPLSEFEAIPNTSLLASMSDLIRRTIWIVHLHYGCHSKRVTTSPPLTLKSFRNLNSLREIG
jgi:hypothetical protein